jgi:ethanolamine ammonia-lyase large subunit
MQPLIDVLAQLNENERNDFTSWLSKLSQKERDRVASVVAKTTIERIRTILSVPEEQRIALFLVEYNRLEELSKEIAEHPTTKRLKEWAEKRKEKARNDKW